MDELLPYYERELSYLRRYGRKFAEQYPKIAARLQMSGETCEDPHVERMIESFAFLSARISKKLEDDYPQFTEALLEVLYPHYLRPFPACSIAQFDASSSLGQLSQAQVIPRGTELKTRQIKGIACSFRTAYDTTLAPLVIRQASYQTALHAPAGTELPGKATGCLSIEIAAVGAAGLNLSSAQTLRVYIDGEPSFSAVLRDALFLHTSCAYLKVPEQVAWKKLHTAPLRPVGFGFDEALIDMPTRSHPAYRLLTEYFAFPEKFNFFDLDLAALKTSVESGAQSFTLHLVLTHLRADSHQARLLEGLSADHLKLGCTPVVNLFKQQADPILVTHSTVSYPVLGNGRHAHALEVYSIDSVKMVRQTPQGDSIVDFRPFYSLRHGEDPEGDGHYWFTHRDERTSRLSPGYELEISIVDRNFNPIVPQTDTLSLELTCTNRDIPSTMAYGLAGGDLFLEGGSLATAIRLLRKPTPSYRFERGRGAQWRLISHLSLNHLSLVKSGLPVFKEMLSLYDLPHSSVSRRQIDGIVDLQHKSATAWLPGNPFANFVRGTEITLVVDEENFVGGGMEVFTRLLDHFFGLYVHANSFVRVVVKSSKTQEDLVRCAPRGGESILV